MKKQNSVKSVNSVINMFIVVTPRMYRTNRRYFSVNNLLFITTYTLYNCMGHIFLIIFSQNYDLKGMYAGWQHVSNCLEKESIEHN